MAGYVQTFGGTTIYPSETSYISLILTGNVELAWPIEQQVSGDIVADIIEVSAAAPGRTVTIPDASQVSTGFTCLINNVGANTVNILNAVGGTIISITPGTAWQIYLADNSTVAGTGRATQFGASVSTAVTDRPSGRRCP